MNPAALKMNIDDLKSGGILIVDTRGVQRAEPEEGRLRQEPARRRLARSLPALPGRHHQADRQRAAGPRSQQPRGAPLQELLRLGLHLVALPPPDRTDGALDPRQVQEDPELVEANLRALHAGYNFGETTELFAVSYEVKPARDRARASTATSPATPPPRSASWRRAARRACRCSSAAIRSRRRATSCTSSRRYKHFDVYTFQAEDEIAGIGAALGAAFGGAIGITTTSGPGMNLKSETIGLAVVVELPLVIVDIQRGGPSTGMPTKTEQADLLQAMYGRHGESPVPILAAMHAGRLLRRRPSRRCASPSST